MDFKVGMTVCRKPNPGGVTSFSVPVPPGTLGCVLRVYGESSKPYVRVQWANGEAFSYRTGVLNLPDRGFYHDVTTEALEIVAEDRPATDPASCLQAEHLIAVANRLSEALNTIERLQRECAIHSKYHNQARERAEKAEKKLADMAHHLLNVLNT